MNCKACQGVGRLLCRRCTGEGHYVCGGCGGDGEQKQTPDEQAQAVLNEVAEEFRISVAILRGKSRVQHVVAARRAAARRLREEFYLPLKGIGQLLGGRDHSTIINLLGERGWDNEREEV